jgi:SAM-dependent methyltransferase
MDAADFMRKEMAIANVWQGDIVDLDIEPGSFNVVVVNHVLEHVADLSATLGKVRAALDPKGLLFVGVPNLSSAGYRLHRGMSFLSGRIPTIVDGVEHTFGFTPRSLGSVLHRAGFTVDSIKAYGRGWTRELLLTILREEGPRRASVVTAEAFFHTKLECFARPSADDA